MEKENKLCEEAVVFSISSGENQFIYSFNNEYSIAPNVVLKEESKQVDIITTLTNTTLTYPDNEGVENMKMIIYSNAEQNIL